MFSIPEQTPKHQAVVWSRRSLLQIATAAVLSDLLPRDVALAEPASLLTDYVRDYVFDGKSGCYIPPSGLYGLFRRDSGTTFDRCMVAAEVHDNAHTHEVQLAVIENARRLNDGRPLIVGFEQFYRSHTGHLGAYVSGDIPLDVMLERTQWKKTWGFNSDLYEPIFEYCRLNRIPMCGLNIPASVAAEVGRVGLDGLSEGIRKYLPADMDFTNAAHYDHFVRLVRRSHNIPDTPEGNDTLRRYYEVQVLWEEWMSQSVAQALDMAPDSRVIALMGSGHVEGRFGFPDRLQRRTNERPYTIIPRLIDKSTTVPITVRPDLSVADLIWYTKNV